MSDQGCYEDAIDLTAPEAGDEKPKHSGIVVSRFRGITGSLWGANAHH